MTIRSGPEAVRAIESARSLEELARVEKELKDQWAAQSTAWETATFSPVLQRKLNEKLAHLIAIEE